MSDVFLSYAREDVGIARQVTECLLDEGFSVFWDREILAGKPWANLIEEEICVARCVVVLWSSASIASDWVKAEAATAAERNILVPVLIEPISPPLRFQVIQCADLVGWHGSRLHAGVVAIISAVRSFAGHQKKQQTEEEAGGRLNHSPHASEMPIAIVRFEAGMSAGRTLRLWGSMTSVTFGRSLDCDVVLEDAYVSRQHCRLRIEPKQPSSAGQDRYRFLLIDSGSVAGVQLNGKSVEGMAEVELQDGDRVQIGGARFRFHTPETGTS